MKLNNKGISVIDFLAGFALATLLFLVLPALVKDHIRVRQVKAEQTINAVVVYKPADVAGQKNAFTQEHEP